MEDERITFKIKDENGKEVECEVLFTFDSDETKKSYMVYTDYKKDEAGNTKVYASIYDPKEDDPVLQPIETEKEWEIVSTILKQVQEEAMGDNNE